MISLKKEITLTIFFLFLMIFNIFSLPAAAKTAVVTIPPQREMLKAVAGDLVEVEVVIPKGFSPSNYAPSPAEMRTFTEASIYFSIGVPADIDNILPRAKEKKELKIVKLFEEVAKKYPHRYFADNDSAAQAQAKGRRDPHFWLSPTRASYMVEIMREELIKILPEHQAEFRKNAEEYLKKIEKIDQENKKLLAPYQNERILVYHPSFGYFTDHYGLKMTAVEKEGREPGPRHLEQIIETAAAEGIKNIFYQPEIDSRKTRAVAESLGGRIIKLNPLAENYSKNLQIIAQKIKKELAKRDDY